MQKSLVIKDQYLTLSRLKYLQKCRRKFALDMQGIVPRKYESAAPTYVIQEHKKLVQLFLSLRATGKPIPAANYSDTVTEELLRNGAPAVSLASFSWLETASSFPLVELRGINRLCVYELKSQINTKRQHLEMLAVKCELLRKQGWEIDDVYLVTINGDFTYKDTGNYHGLFTEKSVAKKVSDLTASAQYLLADSRSVIAEGKVPKAEFSKYCISPSPCFYYHHCSSEFKRNNQSNVLEKAYPSIREVLRNMPRPWHFFDVEAISFTMPRWLGCHPFQRIPFQFSCHTLEDNGSLSHSEFIDTTGVYPVRLFAESLLSTIKSPGTIFVYDISLERYSLQLCKKHCPELSDAIASIENNMVDLLSIIKNNIGDEKISLKLKALVEIVDPSLSYHNLTSVKNGNDVQGAYYQCVFGNTTQEREALQTEMLKYCYRDTEVLVALIKKLGF